MAGLGPLNTRSGTGKCGKSAVARDHPQDTLWNFHKQITSERRNSTKAEA